MNIHTLWAVALCEMRSCSRLARAWIAMSLAFFIASIGYLVVCGQHMVTSTNGPITQIPRFVVGDHASTFIGIFALGIIFLAFDIRARDVRDRIIGIIDAKPISNLELVVGRLGGILMLLCIPLLLFLGLVVLHGALADLAGWSFGAPIEIWSVLSFLVWDVVPQLAWWGGLVMLLAVILRNRLLVVLTAIGMFALNTWIATKLSWGQMEIAGAAVSQVVYPSDVAPIFATGTIILQRVGWMLLSIGLLVTAATFLPRMMTRRGLFGLAGASTFGLGVLVLIGLFQIQSNDPDRKNAWLQVHKAQEISSFPDVQHLKGEVRIKPGNRIDLDLILTVSPPKQNTTNKVTFTLNPGYKIKGIALDSKEIDDYEFKDGLLTIPAHHFGADLVMLAIEASGKPNSRFAYLDARIDLKSASVLDFSVAMARFLGNKSYVFRSDYVALLPGISWYPTSGVAVGRDDLQSYPRDHFTIDLNVTVPKQWELAGPGKSELQPGDNRQSTFRFRPENPVIDVVLIGSRFERVAMTVQDIEFELLYSAKHRDSFAAMESLVPELKEWITDRLTIAEQYGLHYPYEALTVVEVPSHLRVLGGGWSMDSTLYGPGVVMIRETGLPTARFDVKFKDQKGDQSFQELLAYVDNDVQGGNLLNGFARNFFTYQMSPVGRGAIALNYFIEDLVGDLVFERLPYYTTNTALSPLAGAQVQIVIDDEDVLVNASAGTSGRQSRRAQSGTMRVRTRNTHSMSIWSTIEEISLSDLNFHEEPIKSYNTVLLRNTYALSALKEQISEQALGDILRDLILEYRTQNFSYEELREIAAVHEPRFEDITQNWLNTNELPGYVVSKSSIQQLRIDDSEEQIFQTVFKLRNVKRIPGVVKVNWMEEQQFGANEGGSTAGGLPAQLIEPESSYQFAIKSRLQPKSITIDAPMSLNRFPIVLSVPPLSENETVVSGSLPEIKPIQWNPIRSDQVIVDDLDQGFSVFGEAEELEIPTPWFVPQFIVEMGLAFVGQGEDIDRGLPRYSRWNTVPRWSRVQYAGFGRYRNTFAMVRGALQLPTEEPKFFAEFATDLPRVGEWTLEFSVPRAIIVGTNAIRYCECLEYPR